MKLMSRHALISVISDILDQLARGDYQSVVTRCNKSRLTCDQIHEAIVEYGEKVIFPPPELEQYIDAIEVKNAVKSTWSVRVPIWTEKEGRSDLTLELTIEINNGVPTIELDDLHVL